jgi:hypothetical protein
MTKTNKELAARILNICRPGSSEEALKKQSQLSNEELKKTLDRVLEHNPEYMNLHETILTTFGICIMKVHEGLIYDCWDLNKDVFKQGMFVPYTKKKR